MRPFSFGPTEPGLILELRPGHVEGWLRYKLEHTKHGSRIVEEHHNQRLELEPTRFVLDCLLNTLESISIAELARGTATVGAYGLHLLEQHLVQEQFLEVERAATRGVIA